MPIIQIYLNDKLQLKKELQLDTPLNEIRNSLSDDIKTDFTFLNKGSQQIEKDEEEDYKLKMIIKKQTNQLFLSDNKSISNIIEANKDKILEPIEGSKLLFIKKSENDNEERESTNEELKIFKYPQIFFSPSEAEKAFTFLVIGETGNGKTTIINSFLNVVMGITIDTDFRYVIVEEDDNSQIHSKTKNVNIYNIKGKDGSLFQIIDTPGYNDTQGMPQDKIISQKIFEAFQTQLTSINAICFVVKSDAFRLSPTQKYIFHSILDLFGDDVKENFIAMLTFCDGGNSLVINTLKNKESIYSKIIPHVKNPWYYKFNNSAFFSLKRKEKFTEMFWDLGKESFINFISRLKELPKKSLSQSIEVGKERQKLEGLIIMLQQKLKLCLNNVEQCKLEYKIINDLNKDIKDSQNYKVDIIVPKIEKEQLKPGIHTTACLQCNRTCHDNCNIKQDEYKYNCWAMDKNSKKCRICPNKCNWSLHKNIPYIIKYYSVKETITLEELKNKYDNSKSKKLDREKILEKINDKIFSLNAECLETQEEIKRAINRIKEIALMKDMITDEEHINSLIESEKQEHTEGYKERIQYYNMLKEQKKLLVNTYKGSIPELDIIKIFLKKTYSNDFDNTIHKEGNCSIM
jgi:hypothetical protein